jgi:carboxyl-terminal processing protease
MLIIWLPMVATAQTHASTLSAEERFYGLARVWHEITGTFAAPESHPAPDADSLFRAFIPGVLLSVNDYEYYRTLQRFAAAFGDANTRVTMPRHMRDSLVRPPVEIRETRGRFYVTNIDRSLADRIPVGSEVLRINGFETRRYLHDEILPVLAASTPHGQMARAMDGLLEGWVNTRVLLNCLTPDGRTINEMVTRTPQARVQWVRTPPPTAPLTTEWIHRDILLVTITRISKESMASLPDSRQLARARAVILDIRRCHHEAHFEEILYAVGWFVNPHPLLLPGHAVRQQPYTFLPPDLRSHSAGQLRQASRFAFTPSDTVMMPIRMTTPLDSLPLIILTGPETGNAAEHFLMLLRQHPFRATLIGNRTAGATGGTITTPLPGGGSLAVKARYDIYPDDMWILEGFEPDITAPADIKSILNNDDLPLLKALEKLGVR